MYKGHSYRDIPEWLYHGSPGHEKNTRQVNKRDGEVRVRGGGGRGEGGGGGGGRVSGVHAVYSTFSHSSKQVYCVKHTKQPIVNQRSNLMSLYVHRDHKDY